MLIMKTFFERYQFVIFVLLTFAISWFPWYAGIAPETMTMGPSLAAFLVVFISGGRRGFATDSRRRDRSPVAGCRGRRRLPRDP